VRLDDLGQRGPAMGRYLTVVLSFVLVASVACGDSGGSTAGGTTGPSVSTPASTSNAPVCDDLSGEARPRISIKNYKFSPKCFTVTSGSALNVDNTDPATHTFTVVGTSIDSTIQGGGAFHKGSEGLAAGEYTFYCRIHPSMKGSFTVV
jgi:plastocyanin